MLNPLGELAVQYTPSSATSFQKAICAEYDLFIILTQSHTGDFAHHVNLIDLNVSRHTTCTIVTDEPCSPSSMMVPRNVLVKHVDLTDAVAMLRVALVDAAGIALISFCSAMLTVRSFAARNECGARGANFLARTRENSFGARRDLR